MLLQNKGWGLLLSLALLFFIINPVFALTLKVGVHHNPPLVFQDEQGTLTGLCPRILEFIAQREGWKIEYSFDTFFNHLESLKRGELDLLVAIVHSPERAQLFDFTQETVWLNWGTIYTSPNVRIQSFLDLNGKTIFGAKGDIYTSNLQTILQGFSLDYRLIEVGNYEEVFQRVKDEPQGIGVVSRLFGLQFGERYGLRESPLVFSPVSLRFASPKGKHPEILATLDRWISSLKDNPKSVYHLAINEFLEMHQPWRPPRWLILLFTIILGSLGILLFFNRLLQLQIQKKTQELTEKNAALKEEIIHRQEIETKLSFRLELEHLFSQIFSCFLTNLPLPDLAQFALEKVGNFLQTEYLIARLPKEEYFFTTRDRQRPTPLLPTLLKDQSLKERFFREQKLILPVDVAFLELQKSVLFSCPLSTPEEGFLEGILSENDTQREEKIHHLPILMDYLRTLFEYIAAVQKQREQDRWFMVTLQSLGDAVITTDPEGLVTYLNPVAENLTLWTLSEARGKPIDEVFVVVDEKSGKPVPNPVRKVLAEGKVAGFANSTLLIRRNGEQINIDDSGAPIIGENGEIQGIVLVFRDVTEKRRLEIQARESERTYRSLFNALPDGFLLLETMVNQGELIDYRIVEANPAFSNFLPHSINLSGKLLNEVFPNWKERWPLPLDLPLTLGIKPFKKEIFFPELNSFWEITSFALSPHHLGVIISDITQRKNAEERIRYFTFHDSLTGLYNRVFAEEELKRFDDNRHIPLSIIFADLNGLKFINDVFGHHQGDMMLQKAAHILKTSCRQGDVVARFGGDEFLVILPHTPYSLVTKIAERIQRYCVEEKGKNPFFLGLSVGTATKVKPTEDLWSIIQVAEESSYERKLQERSLYQEKAVLPLLEKALFQLHCEEKEEVQKLKETVLKFGEKLQLPKEELHKISLLAYFHDVGKLALPPEIIKKQGPLTEEEQTLLESCPTAGYRIARMNQELLLIAEEIHAFREHYDGSGYPLRKKREEIPFLTRVVQIVEAYWALRSPRPYRPEPFSHVQALTILQKEAGYRFDPELVEAFLSFSREEVFSPDIHKNGG